MNPTTKNWQRRLALFALPTVFGGILLNCGDDGSAGFTTGPCADTLASECGKACTADNDCADGLYCNTDDICFAECTKDTHPCETGTCSDDGRCLGGGGAGGAGGLFPTGGDGGDGGDGGAGGSCGNVSVNFEPQIPSVVLLIDQSGSMTENFNGQQRWNVVYDALMAPDGVVKTLEGQVRFSLALYTYTSGPTCPQLVEVGPPALNAHTNIEATYSGEVPLSNTPTGDSITAITPALAAFAEPGPKIIILATDGDPDRCADPDGHDQISKDLSTDAVTAAYAENIQTFIIAVGNQVSQQHQQDMANAGQGLPYPAPNPCNDPLNCAPTFEPATKQAMIDDFNEIINGQRTCIFQLDGQVIDGKECDGTVTINGMDIPCNDPEGWQLNGPNEIEFVGQACQTILNDSEVDISASFPCDAISSGGVPN